MSRPRRRTVRRDRRGRSYCGSKAKTLSAMKKAHFSHDLFAFLDELRSNNRREWFEANRARYERDVREPTLAFIADFAPQLKKISPKLIADPRPSDGSMFRIYRDVRF